MSDRRNEPFVEGITSVHIRAKEALAFISSGILFLILGYFLESSLEIFFYMAAVICFLAMFRPDTLP